MPIKLNSTSGGSVTLDVPATAATYTLKLPTVTANLVSDSANSVTQSMLSTGLAGTGPLFFARQTVSQTLTSGTNVKVTFTSEEFDTANCYDTSTSKFTPNVAGYYYISSHIRFGTSSACQSELAIYKNGSAWAVCSINQQGSNDQSGFINCMVYCNGSTDYIEIYANQNNGSSVSTQLTDNIGSTNKGIWFTGHLIRSA